MAGPGGGPPRKTHFKSRKGCKTCKKRHIRCDEQFPQCRKCTKHNCRCDYMDSPPPADDAPKSPRRLDLLWTPAIEAEIDKWQQTGYFPFAELGASVHNQFQGLSKTDLRLVHHLCSVFQDLRRTGMVHCASWVQNFAIFLEIATSHDFVMSSILAFSATHIAWINKNGETTNLAYQYRGVAFGGLQGAIGNFSEKNSDPILAASILLLWQASDWGGWTSLMQGISTVVSSMDPWRDASRLANYVDNYVVFQTPAFLQLSLSPLNAPVFPDDDRSLEEAIQALQHLTAYVQAIPILRQSVEEILRSALDIRNASATMRDQQLFEILQSFRARVLWEPISLLQSADRSNSHLVVVAHLYATALAVDASIPELNGAALGALTTVPIEEIDRQIRYGSSPTQRQSIGSPNDIMHFPRQLAAKMRYQRTSMVQLSRSQQQMNSQQNEFDYQNLHIESAPGTPGFPPTHINYFNPSSEDLSVPPSPFLQTYVSPTSHSRRHSGLVERSPGPSSLNFEHRSWSGLSYRGDSPGYSPAYSPGPTFEDEHVFGGGESSFGGYHSGDFSYDDPSDKGKSRLP